MRLQSRRREEPELNLTSLIDVVLLLVIFFVYLATTNLGLIDSQSNLTASTKFKISVFVVQYGSWVLPRSMAAPMAGTCEQKTAELTLAITASPQWGWFVICRF